MEGTAILNLRLSDINEAPFKFKSHDDGFFKTKYLSFIAKYGIPQLPVVTRIDGDVKYFCVDGDYLLLLLRELGIEVVPCIVLKGMTHEHYITARLFLTARYVRPNYIDIATAISSICKTERDCLMVANETTIPYDDVKNYQNLLTFDWEAFLKAPINQDQLKLFEDER